MAHKPTHPLRRRDPDFVILSAQRTGSTMLSRLLDSHPRLRCYGELFVRDANTAARDLAALPGDLGDRYLDIAVREKRWRMFLRTVARRQSMPWGFKLQLNQHFEVHRHLARRTRCRVIVLRRENVLAVYASSELARAEKPGPVRFDPERFLKHMHSYYRRYTEIDRLLSRHNRAPLLLTYEALTGPEREIHHARLARHVGVLPRSLTTDTDKRHSDDILGRFSNPGEAQACLRSIGRLDWAAQPARGPVAGGSRRPVHESCG